MSLRFKIDILAALKAAGYSSYKLIQEGLLSASTVQKLRDGQPLSWDNIDRICTLLNCQPGDIIEHLDEEEHKEG